MRGGKADKSSEEQRGLERQTGIIILALCISGHVHEEVYSDNMYSPLQFLHSISLCRMLSHCELRKHNLEANEPGVYGK